MWIEELLKNYKRKKVTIRFDPHVFSRETGRNLDLGLIEQTVRTGWILARKCEEPNKICFKRYFGKNNESYVTIVLIQKNYFEVKTSWKIKGR